MRQRFHDAPDFVRHTTAIHSGAGQTPEGGYPVETFSKRSMPDFLVAVAPQQFFAGKQFVFRWCGWWSV